MNILLSLLKSPQYILIFIIITVLGYLIYDYISLKSFNQEMSTQIALEASQRRAIEERYDALSNRVEEQERVLNRYIEGIERIENESEELRQKLQEVEDENVRKSLDTVLDHNILDSLFQRRSEGN